MIQTTTMEDNAKNEKDLTLHNKPETSTENNRKDPETDKQKNVQVASTKKEAHELAPMEEEPSKMVDAPSPKRNKKLKTERDPNQTRERTRSKSRCSRLTSNEM
jgi:hypothetical protein